MTLPIRQIDINTRMLQQRPNIFNALHRSTRKVQRRPAKPINLINIVRRLHRRQGTGAVP